MKTSDGDLPGDLFSANPSRQPVDFTARPGSPSVNLPFRSEEEEEERKLRSERADLIRDICRVFNIPVNAVMEATWQATGERYLSFEGLTEVAGPFPASIVRIKPTKGKGRQLSLGSFLSNPLADKTLLEFYASVDFSYNAKPVLMVGVLPWFKGKLAITNLPLEPDHFCFSVSLDVNLAKAKVKEVPEDRCDNIRTVVFGSLTYILHAIRGQNLWLPLE